MCGRWSYFSFILAGRGQKPPGRVWIVLRMAERRSKPIKLGWGVKRAVCLVSFFVREETQPSNVFI
jgi:hypothetical protein